MCRKRKWRSIFISNIKSITIIIITWLVVSLIKGKGESCNDVQCITFLLLALMHLLYVDNNKYDKLPITALFNYYLRFF